MINIIYKTLQFLVCLFKMFKSTECISYVITETLVGIVNLKGACEELNGVMASEDLKDRLLGNLLINY